MNADLSTAGLLTPTSRATGGRPVVGTDQPAMAGSVPPQGARAQRFQPLPTVLEEPPPPQEPPRPDYRLRMSLKPPAEAAAPVAQAEPVSGKASKRARLGAALHELGSAMLHLRTPHPRQAMRQVAQQQRSATEDSEQGARTRT